MARPGPAPKPNKIGRTPNAEWTEVPDVPFGQGRRKKLPAPPPDGWHPLTEKWWATVREMPHAALWTEPDWLFAADTARLKDAFYRDQLGSGALTEMRHREDLIAMTSEARRRSRIRYVAPPPPEPKTAAPSAGTVPNLAERRARLLAD